MFRSLSASVLFAAVVLAAGCSDSLCGNEIVAQVKSPDGLRTAFLFQRDCGATTGFSTQVSVVRGETLPNSGGNVFVADSDHGAAPVAAWGGPPAELRWLDASTLEVSYHPRARTFEKAEVVDGVSIRYVFLGDA